MAGNTSTTPPTKTCQAGVNVAWQDEQTYLKTAHSHTPIADKVTGHAYQIMYGQFLMPYYRTNPKMKLLEIGLGCGMKYGPGASVKLYRELFPLAELWEAEYNGNCVEKSKANGQLEGIHTLVGDQGDPQVLEEWITKSGGDFDVIIDDGGHQNCQIWTSFLKLWPNLKSGGLYFMEDLQVGRTPAYKRAASPLCEPSLVVSKKLTELVETLIYDVNKKAEVKFIFCQSEACVLKKK